MCIRDRAHTDWNVCPEIMIPLVGDIKEFKFVKKIVVETADAEIAAAGSDLKYEVCLLYTSKAI